MIRISHFYSYQEIALFRDYLRNLRAFRRTEHISGKDDRKIIKEIHAVHSRVAFMENANKALMSEA